MLAKEKEEAIIEKVEQTVNDYNSQMVERYRSSLLGFDNYGKHCIYIGTIDGIPEIISCNSRCIPDYFYDDIEIENGDFINVFNTYMEYIKNLKLGNERV